MGIKSLGNKTKRLFVMMDKRNRTESCVSETDFTPLVNVSESVPVGEVIQPVPTDVHKNMEVTDKDLNKNSDEDVGDDAFLDKTAEEKNKKRERTEVDKVSNEDSDVELDEDTPVKKKVKKSPSKAPAKKTTRRKMIPRKTGGNVSLNVNLNTD